MNIVLIGYRCSGKTSTGKLLAEKLGRPFIDTDDLIINKTGATIDKTVSNYGWQHFRDVEKSVIKEVSSAENLVIATGGGIIINEENIRNLKDNGFIVWLYTDTDTIKKRLNEDKTSAENRPSLTGDDPIDEINKVLEERKSFYRSASDMTVDTTQLDISEVADKIIEEIEKL